MRMLCGVPMQKLFLFPQTAELRRPDAIPQRDDRLTERAGKLAQRFRAKTVIAQPRNLSCDFFKAEDFAHHAR